jgi:hypothetical protein
MPLGERALIDMAYLLRITAGVELHDKLIARFARNAMAERHDGRAVATRADAIYVWP